MGSPANHAELPEQPIEHLLGYLNFSSGNHDPRFHSSLNWLFGELQTTSGQLNPIWKQACDRLRLSLDELAKDSAAFSDHSQATETIALLEQFFPAYLEHHSDLLGHQREDELFNSFFVGRVTECLLGTDKEPDQKQTVGKVMKQLNDYVGYRPVATLSSKKIEPYANEWLRPLPIYLKDCGVAFGKYRAVVEICLDLLNQTDPMLLRAAYFDPSHLHELAIDPRAFDFDHPASKRPNYQFGLWDPHCIDGDGFYTRFIVQQMTLDSLTKRFEESNPLPEKELLIEAAAVLAGTILMSSGISGHGPETHDSTVSLSDLLRRIAGYRDEFYRQLIAKMDGTHGARLRQEAKELQQPFGGARQALNRELAHQRALQLQRVHLSRIYARMDYPEASFEQTALIEVPSARLNSEIDCKLTEAKRQLDRGELATSLAAVNHAREVLIRGIECGAIVDPWNILGFDANFSLFRQIENSIRDVRIDELIEIIEEMMELFAQIWSKAVAMESSDVAHQTKVQFEEFANWWHQFAAHEMDSVNAENPLDVFEAANNVAEALEAWRKQGEASGDIGFWAPHVQRFDSCRAYWLVIDTLLSRDDKVASLGLLMHWLSQADRIPLEHGETSFFQLSMRWLATAVDECGQAVEPKQNVGWKRIRRFFDYLEANLGSYEYVPEFEPEPTSPPESKREELLGNDQDEAPGDEDDDLFQAAYENVVYRDSTDDGQEGSIFDFEPSPNEDYLHQRSQTILDYTSFIDQIAAIWKMTSVIWVTSVAKKDPDTLDQQVSESIRDLLNSTFAAFNRVSQDLDRLIASIHGYRISRMGTDPESMTEYNRLRMMKDSLLEQVVTAKVSVIEALQYLGAATDQHEGNQDDATAPGRLLRACMLSDAAGAQSIWPQVQQHWAKKPILYIPVNRGGEPTKIAETRSRQQLIQSFMIWLPRLGMLTETFGCIELIREMELNPVGQGAITEFDDMFEVACRSLVTSLVDSYQESKAKSPDELVDQVESMTEPLLRLWLEHSRTLRLSVLEPIVNEESWLEIVEFIREYGKELFTQRFLNWGNVNGILHQGVESWLEQLATYGDEAEFGKLISATEKDEDRKEIAEKLSLILEAIAENYSEYRDYNSITTQSDQGDLLFTLLDFLRLRVSYDRVAWNLNPVIIAHKVLAARHCDKEAQMWRQGLEKRIAGEAKRHIQKLSELQSKYAMALPSVLKRINEKFMRPLRIDYLCSLIEPATMAEDAQQRAKKFELIRKEADRFLTLPSGAGHEIPGWLLAMADTIRVLHTERRISLLEIMDERMKPVVVLTPDELQQQIDDWSLED